MRFTPEGDGTRVDLEHRGWERYPAELGPDTRASYASADGWERVLSTYVAAASS